MGGFSYAAVCIRPKLKHISTYSLRISMSNTSEINLDRQGIIRWNLYHEILVGNVVRSQVK